MLTKISSPTTNNSATLCQPDCLCWRVELHRTRHLTPELFLWRLIGGRRYYINSIIRYIYTASHSSCGCLNNKDEEGKKREGIVSETTAALPASEDIQEDIQNIQGICSSIPCSSTHFRPACGLGTKTPMQCNTIICRPQSYQ